MASAARTRTTGAAALGLLLSTALGGCSDDGTKKKASTTLAEATLVGSVKSLDGNGIPGVKVSLDGKEITANESGWFVASKLSSAERGLVSISAPDYVPTQKVVALKEAQSSFLDARLFALAEPKSVDPAEGGEVSADGAKLVIPKDALRKKSGGAPKGMARVNLTVIDPTMREGRLAAPGDFTGIKDGKESRLQSFGMAHVAMRDEDDDELTFTSGKRAQLSIPVPSVFKAAPPSSVPLWRYDESEGRWVESGSADYDPGSETYVGDIDRDQYWNADLTYSTACWKGQVVSPEGDAAPAGLRVAAEGITYVGEAQTTTDAEGRFSVQVMASSGDMTASARIYAQGGGLYAQIEPGETPSELASTGKCTDVGKIELAYPLATMALTWGADPSDLDSHFTGPDGQSGRFEVYYGNRDVDGANLDTDDTSSFGPEVVSLLKAEPGEYVYSVLNYSGESSGPIVQSSAEVTALFPDEQRTFEVASAENKATGEDTVWRVFGFTIDARGHIGELKPINEIVDQEDGAFDP
jgi:hypothetical protein